MRFSRGWAERKRERQRERDRLGNDPALRRAYAPSAAGCSTPPVQGPASRAAMGKSKNDRQKKKKEKSKKKKRRKKKGNKKNKRRREEAEEQERDVED